VHPSLSSAPPARLRQRRDFLAANQGVRIVTPAFILLVRPNGTARARFGFTVSRRIGNAVARNRARRRLREMARLAIGTHAIPGADHVFIARPQPAERPFAVLMEDARTALARAASRLAATSAAATSGGRP
jgi:ribonuclease P protein component